MKKEKVKYEKPTNPTYKRVLFITTRVVVGLIMIAAIIQLINKRDVNDNSNLVFVFTNSLTLLICTFIPSILERTWKIDIPSIYEIIFIFVAILAFFFGSINSFYVKFSWWDDMLHTMSGCLICCLGFVILNMLNDSDYVRTRMSPAFICTFAFCFSIAVGALWEVIEYSLDALTGSNMQRYSDNLTGEGFIGRAALDDTMHDIILDSIGAFVISLVGFFDLHRKKRFTEFRVSLLKKIDDKEDETKDEVIEESNEIEEPKEDLIVQNSEEKKI